jgi:hypothetical protein
VKDTITLQGREYDCTFRIMKNFGVSPMTIIKWREQGLLPPPLKLGVMVYYDRELVERRTLEQCQ